MEERRLAFVLSGGGARGAFQVGALKALYENNIHPEILVGTSIGAVNAAFLAVHGINSSSIERLIQTWMESVRMDLLPKHFAWLTLRTILKTPDYRNFGKLQNFLVAHGVRPDLRFRDMREIQLYLWPPTYTRGNCFVRTKPWPIGIRRCIGILRSAAFLPALRARRQIAHGTVELSAICRSK